MEEEAVIWISKQGSMVSTMIGRAMNSLLSCRPKKLENAITRLTAPASTSSDGSLEESLCLLNNYIRDAADREEPLDEVLVPIIQHSLRCKESRSANQALLLLNWLFRDDVLFKAIVEDFVNIMNRKDDHYIALGWCVLVSSIVNCETAMEPYMKDGLSERHYALVKTLSSSIPNLLLILQSGSVWLEGFELPTRLAVAAADCILILTEALTKKRMSSGNPEERTSSRPYTPNKPVYALHEKQVEQSNTSSAIGMELMLWEHINDLIVLVQKLNSWSRKSQPLRMKGSEKVLHWLQELKSLNNHFQDEPGSNALNPGASLLSSCWKHYSLLLRLEDCGLSRHCDELMNQYLSGFQLYADEESKKYSASEVSSIETKKFFLNCLALLLGRLNRKRMASLISEYGSQISSVLLSQLCCADEDVVDGAVCILRLFILETAKNNLGSQGEIEALLPSLLHLLDERDGAARAAVALVAECCLMDTWCVQEVLKSLDSGGVPQRRNAVDVISELVNLSADSAQVVCDSMWKDIANHLLDRLGDEESVIRRRTIKLLPLIDPSIVLPSLIRLAYSSNEIMSSSAVAALTEVLRHHSQKFEVIDMLLDCLSNLCHGLDKPKVSRQAMEDTSKADIDRVLQLIPDWAKMVQDWKMLIGPMLEKAFSEPSNAIIIRFLGYISDHLADANDLVLCRILLQAKRLQEIDNESFSKGQTQVQKDDNDFGLQKMLFDRLSPLLIIRLLPLWVFDDLDSAAMYGQFSVEGILLGNDVLDVDKHECVATFLLKRAFCQYEFDDVRKLAAELCGRIHPLVLIPVAFSQLEQAAESKDVLKIKACLFSICTSLALRGRISVSHPVMPKIIKVLQTILLWPSMVGNEVSKAQHGCIDCLALMICAELKASKPQKSSCVECHVTGDVNPRTSVLALVIEHLTNDTDEISCLSVLEENRSSRIPYTIPFRLCMANVLISACQKISDPAKKNFAQKTLPHLINSIRVITDVEIRAACVQVLFSAVYHLKAVILPYASSLLKLAVDLLNEGSEKERVSGAKLVASLMGSEDIVAESISDGLWEVRSIMSRLSQSDPSTELRQLCKKLLLCLTIQ